MLFSSLTFLFLFLPLILIIYYTVRIELRNYVLLFFSLFFYAWGEPKYILLMLFSISINYIFGLLVDRWRGTKYIKLILGLSVVFNLGLLGIFKYTNFIIENMKSFGLEFSIAEIRLPIGISFFTFQAMSYVIDVYRKEGKCQKNPLNLALYISFFPQLIAGPIVRYQTVAKQIEERRENFEQFSEGTKRFIRGLGKKAILANGVGYIADQILTSDFSNLSLTGAWLGIIAYTLQIYFDFSGYSDMAIGLGKMFGFEFLENFNYPYISKSITEFWRRWHISLGSWFRDYLYIPLGGNKGSKYKFYRNIFIVWLATGLWHGASWNFIFWGVFYGVLIVLERNFLLKLLEKLPSYISRIYTLWWSCLSNSL